MAGLVPPGTSTIQADASKKVHTKAEEKTHYMNFPCPTPFEELHRKAFMSLKQETFEGLQFDFIEGLNKKFSRSHIVLMSPTKIPSQSAETIKIPTSQYEFGANFIDPNMLIRRVMADGRLNARVKWDLTDNLTVRANAQLTNKPHLSHGMINFDYKGKDYKARFQTGNGES